MKKKLVLLTCLVGLMACQRAEIVDPADNEIRRETKFTAIIDSYSSGTKTSLDGINVVWSDDDLIAIYEGEAAPNKYGVTYGGSVNTGIEFISAHGIGGKFSTVAELVPPTNVAVYPYIDNKMDCRNLTVPSGSTAHYKIANFSLPATQNYVFDNIPLGAGMMVAVTKNIDDGELRFKNVGGIIELKFTGDIKVKTISIKGNNAEKLSGKAEVEVANDAMPVISFKPEALDIVTLDCGNAGVQLSSEATAFHMVLPPVVFTKGFTVTISDVNGKTYEFKKTSSGTITRSGELQMPTLDMSRFTEVVAPSTNTDINQLISTTETNPKFDVRVGSAITEINLGSGFTKEETTASELVLNYTEAPESITINQYGVDYATAVPGSSKGKIIINLPEGSTVPSIIATVPNMTLEINGGTIESLDVLTAYNTLVVKSGATIKALNVRGGNVSVENGAKVESITKNGKTAEQLANGDVNKKPLYVFTEAGAVIPTLPKGDYDNSVAIVPVTDAEQWNIIKALATADSYTLQDNSVISSTIVVDKEFTLDLNGYTITNDSDLYNVYDSQQFMVVVCRGGHLTIEDGKGTGKIATKEEETDRNTATMLAVALTHYGEEKWASTTPASLTVEGGHLYGRTYGISGNGTRYNTNITINGGLIEGGSHAIYHPQDGNFTMIGGALKGKAGIEIRGGGDYTISGGTIEATAPWKFEQAAGTTTSEGGAVVVNMYDQANRGNLELNITGGTFTGERAVSSLQPSFTNYTGKATVNLRGGTFKGSIYGRHNSRTQEDFDVYGGTFNKFDAFNKTTDNADVKVVLDKDIKMTDRAITKERKLSVDINGHKLSFSSYTREVSDNAEFKIFDSKANGIPTEANLIPTTTYDNVFEVKGNGKLTLQNVKSSHNKLAYIWANEGNVTIENSDISGSSYIFTTSAEIKGSTLKFGSGANWVVNNSTLSATQTPIMMNVPLTASIQNSTLSGTWQCAMVRGGTLNLTRSTLNYTRDGAFAEIAAWGNGNNVPRAAITGGCKSPHAIAYNYPTSITIDAATTINMLGANNTNPKVYLYSDGLNTVSYNGTYDESVMIGTGSKPVTINGEAVTPAFTVYNTDQLKAALAAGTEPVINLAAGTYELGGATVSADVTLKGKSKTGSIINMGSSLYPTDKKISFESLTYNVPTGLAYAEGTLGFIHRAAQVDFNDCAINGRLRLNSTLVNVNNCVFTVNTKSGWDGYALFYYGGDQVNVNNCTFNTAGKGIVMYKEGAHNYKLNVEGCTFTSSGTTDKAAIQMHTEYGITGEVSIKNTTATGFADVNGGLWNDVNNNTKVPTYNFDIYVDDVKVHSKATLVSVGDVANTSFDPTKDYVIGAGVLAIESGKTIAGKTVQFVGTEFQTTTNVNINAENVVMKGVKVSGSNKNSVNSTISINGANTIDIDGADFTMTGSRCYNGFEINLSAGAAPQSVNIKNVNFSSKLSNNAITIFRTSNNAVVNIENCTFAEVSNCLRLSNADDASGVVVNVKDCTCNKWDASADYAGFLLCQDYTSSDANSTNLFAPSKLTVNFDNLTGPSGKTFTGKTQSQLTGTGAANQLYYVYYDKGTVTGIVSYDSAKHPTITVK